MCKYLDTKLIYDFIKNARILWTNKICTVYYTSFIEKFPSFLSKFPITWTFFFSFSYIKVHFGDTKTRDLRIKTRKLALRHLSSFLPNSSRFGLAALCGARCQLQAEFSWPVLAANHVEAWVSFSLRPHWWFITIQTCIWLFKQNNVTESGSSSWL